MKPTKEQQQIIDHNEGRAVVFAVAGSGKTSTVVKRINRLVGEAGYRPERILATTFSRAAKAQLDQKLQKETHCSQVKASTLHALALRVMKFRGEMLHAPQRIVVDDDKLSSCFYTAKDRLRQGCGINHRESVLDSQKIEEIGSEDFFNFLMQLKGDLLATEWCHDQLPQLAKPFFDVEDFSNSLWLEALINTYEDERRKEKYLGFDDIMVNATIVLGSSTELRDYFSAQFQFIFVDEYQDVNKAQDKMLQFLDEKAQNMMVIGDDDQTIYEWRGARPEIIRSKLSDSSWTSFKLSRNFRSSPGPVVLASQCIARNKNRAPKRMLPMRQFSGPLDIRRLTTASDQAKAVVEVVKDNKERYGHYSNAVILIRQYAETPLIEQELISNKIPYEIPGSRPFYFRRETKYILDYLELFVLEKRRQESRLNGEESDQFAKALSRIYTRPKTYMRRSELEVITKDLLDSSESTLADALDRYNAYKEDNGKSRSEGVDDLVRLFLKASKSDIHDFKAVEAISLVDQETKIRQWIIETAVHEKVGLVRAQIIPALAEYAEADSIIKFLSDIERAKKFNSEEIRGDNISRVKILTVFRSKGLEFPTVVIPNMDCAESESVSPENVPTSQRDVASMREEERRIFYVAMTRAINDLHVFYTSPNPSPYLTEANYKTVQRDMSEMEILFQGEIERLTHKDSVSLAEFIVRSKHYQIGNACARAWAKLLDEDSGKKTFDHLMAILDAQAMDNGERIEAAKEYLEKIFDNSKSMRSRLVNEPYPEEPLDGDGQVIKGLPEDDGEYE